MNRTQQILIAVILVQIVIGVLVFLPQGSPVSAEVLLFSGLSKDKVTSLSLESSGSKISFTKEGDLWVLPDADKYPADVTKIEAFLDKVLAIRNDRLIAENESSFKRLQVTAEDNVAKISFTTSDAKSYLLLMGSASGPAATNVRLDGQDKVYLTDKISTWDVSIDASNWIKVVYLETTYADMTYMSFSNQNGTFTFEKDVDGNWNMDGLSGDETLNPNNLISVLNRLTLLNMSTPLGKENKPEYGMNNPSAVVVLRTNNAVDGEKEFTLTIGALNTDKNNFYVKSSASDYYVLIPNFSVDSFITRKKDDFLMVHATPTP